MVAFEEALDLIARGTPAPKKAKLPLAAALGGVLSEDFVAPFPSPRFDNSAMDGFALRSTDTASARPGRPARLRVKGIARAGDAPAPLAVGQATRILTGAAMPEGADTVIPVERADLDGSSLLFDSPYPGRLHVRYRGEELEAGSLVLPKGSVVTPAVAGILAGFGQSDVWAYRRPRVALVATGSELVSPGKPLGPAKIYDSNSPMIGAALSGMGIAPVLFRKAGDRPAILRRLIRWALKEADVVLLTGGVSVGEADYVKPVLAELGVKTVFWQVNQKPGKPLFFGKKGDALVFALPGNPAAVFTCFYEYVYPTIRRLAGHAAPRMKSVLARISEPVKSDPQKLLFLKASLGSDRSVRVLGGQASHMISSLSRAEGFLVVPPGRALAAGDWASFDLLPDSEGSLRES